MPRPGSGREAAETRDSLPRPPPGAQGAVRAQLPRGRAMPSGLVRPLGAASRPGGEPPAGAAVTRAAGAAGHASGDAKPPVLRVWGRAARLGSPAGSPRSCLPGCIPARLPLEDAGGTRGSFPAARRAPAPAPPRRRSAARGEARPAPAAAPLRLPPRPVPLSPATAAALSLRCR